MLFYIQENIYKIGMGRWGGGNREGRRGYHRRRKSIFKEVLEWKTGRLQKAGQGWGWKGQSWGRWPRTFIMSVCVVL